MQDRISKFPGRVRLNPVDGQENVFDLVRADEPEVEGTPLNKGNLLSDDVATSFGLIGDSATPDGAFKAIKNDYLTIGNLHVWKHEDAQGNASFFVSKNRNAYPEGAQDYKEAYIDLGPEISNIVLIKGDINSSNTYIYSERGEVSVLPDGSLLLDVHISGSTNPRYFDIYGDEYITVTKVTNGTTTGFELNQIYYIPSGAKKTTGTDVVTISKAHKVIGVPESKSGTYTYMGQLGDGAKFASGSFAGTGSNKTLILGFEPKFISIQSTIYNNNNKYMTGGIWNSGSDYGFHYAITDGNSPSIYSKQLCAVNGDNVVINNILCSSGYTYYYVAIG